MKHVQEELELRKYLLGELSFTEQVLIEQRLFLDSEYAELHQAVEDDLVDEYLKEELGGTERERFEKYFLLLPEHGADLKIAQALNKYIATTADTDNNRKQTPVTLLSFINRRTVWLSLAIAAVTIVSPIGWLFYKSRQVVPVPPTFEAKDPSRPSEVPQASPISPNDNKVEIVDKKPDHPKNPERKPEPVLSTLMAPLLPGPATRSNGGTKQTLALTADFGEVVLQLRFGSDYQFEKYRAELLSGTRKLKDWPNLISEADEQLGTFVSVRMRANILREQTYRVRLYGVATDQQPEEPLNYSFSVDRK